MRFATKPITRVGGDAGGGLGARTSCHHGTRGSGGGRGGGGGRGPAQTCRRRLPVIATSRYGYIP